MRRERVEATVRKLIDLAESMNLLTLPKSEAVKRFRETFERLTPFLAKDTFKGIKLIKDAEGLSVWVYTDDDFGMEINLSFPELSKIGYLPNVDEIPDVGIYLERVGTGEEVLSR